MDFSIIDRAGITQAQYAKLVGVSRVSVSSWTRGSRPRDNLRSRIALSNAALERAIEAGDLPIPADAHASMVNAALAKVASSVDVQGA